MERKVSTFSEPLLLSLSLNLRHDSRGLKEAGHHVARIEEQALDGEVGGRGGDGGQVRGARRAQVGADHPDGDAREFGCNFGGGGSEEGVVQGDEDDIDALGGQLAGQGLADACVELRKG